MLKEIWKDIQGYEGIYQVSNLGRIKSLSHEFRGVTKTGKEIKRKTKEKMLTIYKHKGRRSNIQTTCEVILSNQNKKKHFSVHRLVALHFVENDNPNIKTQVNHIDGNRMNNVATNLEWCTPKENVNHAFNNGLIKTRRRVQQIDKVTGEVIKEYDGETKACKAVGVGQGKISSAIKRNGTCKGYKWKYIS